MAKTSAKINQPNREELLQMAENAARKGHKDGARVLFGQVLEQDKRNERAMMWLAKLARTKKERKRWLERLVRLNPENEAAKAALEKINYQQAARENRTLVFYGTVAAALIIIMIIVVIAVFALRG